MWCRFPSSLAHTPAGRRTKKRPGTGKKFLIFCFDPMNKCIVLCLNRRALRMLVGEADESVTALCEKVLAYQAALPADARFADVTTLDVTELLRQKGADVRYDDPYPWYAEQMRKARVAPLRELL